MLKEFIVIYLEEIRLFTTENIRCNLIKRLGFNPFPILFEY